MADAPINLNKARKAKVRADKQVRAAENRSKHGRTKAEKLLSKAKSTKAATLLDGHKREK